MKKLISVLLVVLFALSMVGCSNQTAAPAEAPQAGAEAPKATVRAALITNPVGTSAYIDQGISGFKDACAAAGFDASVIECKNTAEYEENSRAAANEGFDLMLAGSWEAASIFSELADAYPQISFGIVDTVTESDNVKCIQYYEGEGAYLIGQIAALTIDEGVHNYGCVHVSESASSWKWRYGYTQGVLSLDPEAKFVFNYVNSYSDPATAKELALQQFELGCGFINAACAGGDYGVFEAAKEKGFYTSGQDIDLTDPANPYIVSSQLKGAYRSIQYMVEQFAANNWTTDNETLGVAEGGVGAVWVTADSANPRSERLSDEDIALLKETAQKLASGEIDMRNLPDEATVDVPFILN